MLRICNALRTSLLFNTPYLSRSAYTAKVTKENCVACGKCVETCPVGAVKLGQKLCHKDGTDFKYSTPPLPDNNILGVRTHGMRTTAIRRVCQTHIPRVPLPVRLRARRTFRYRLIFALRETANTVKHSL